MNYYVVMMGEWLMKWLLVFEMFMLLEEFVKVKIVMNQWEFDYVKEVLGDVEWFINIDFGYVIEVKFVLVMMKDCDYCIYFRDGIFVEVMLYFVWGKWRM